MGATFKKKLIVEIPILEVLNEYIKTKGTAAERQAWANMQRSNIASITINVDDLVIEANAQRGV